MTTVHFVPSMLQVFVESGELQKCGSLRRVICSGEALPFELQERFFRTSTAELHNLYGPTEAAVDVTFWECERESVRGVVPIGRPIANTEIYLLDERLQAVPVGVCGELYIGGAGLARGYYGRAAMTAERFVPHPYSGRGGDRLYRTGDLARYLEDGEIEYLGRMDHQVKLRGFRIELGEIEAALSAVSGVREAVVEARAARGGAEKRLVAYVVWESGFEGSVNELRRQLKERLPDYMSPSAYVELAQLPLTANGKVDRRALPEPEVESGTVADEVGRTPVEELLCGIWAEVLGIERVGLDDDFFELGGHSLLATQVVSRVRETCGVELALRELFESPTVRALALAVEAARRADDGGLAPPIVAVSRDRDLPLSFAQQRLWFLDQLEPQNPFYNIPAGVRLSGPLNVEALGHAVSELVNRHEVLRTSFKLVAGQAVQVIGDGAEVRVEETDLSELPADEREAEARRIAAESGQQPFDLGRGPLMRVKLLRLSEAEHVLVVVLHHIVSDGWSMGVLVRELVELYAARCEEREARLTALPVQYADFAVWQREWLSGEELERQLGYWRKHLADAPQLLELPTDRPRPAMQTYRGARESFSFNEELSAQLRLLARREGTTLFMAVLAIWQVLLWRYTGQTDIVVGSPIANRNRAETENLIGFFVNTLVLRSRLLGQQSFRELLKQVREMTLDAYAHQDVPFEKLVEELQPERTLSHSPLFQVMFILQNTTQSDLDVAGIEFKPLSTNTGTAQFDMTLDVAETDQQIYGVLNYNTDLFDATTVRRMVAHFEQLLGSVVADPAQTLSDLTLLSESERERVLYKWNDTRVDYHDSHASLHQLIEAQVARTPGAVALVFGDNRLTYAELNERSTLLAQHLHALDVRPDTPVAVCFERSIEMVVALLAVLKAGGAYLPLDPTYPAERLQFMLEESRPRLLLAQESLLERLPKTDQLPVICLDSYDWSAHGPGAHELPTVSGDNLAYVIYTSGSTGRPKGVMNTHAGLVNRLLWMQDRYGLDSSDRVLQKTPYSFDVSVWEFFWPLMTGARLVLAEPEGHKDSAYLARLIAAQKVTTVHCVPS
ncbi:MAG TPA: condensation domain-containing protein, partial [Pyrinomonadaceae bacterium]